MKLSRLIAAEFPGVSNEGLRAEVRAAFARAPEGESSADTICVPIESRVALSHTGRATLRALVDGVLSGAIPATWDISSANVSRRSRRALRRGH